MMEDSFDPEAEQEAERMCLEAVMMDEYEELSAEQLSAHRTRRRLSLTILPYPSAHEANHVQAVLEATLEPTYPVLLPLVSLRNAPTASHKLSEAVLQEMGTRLAEVSSEHAGSVHLMALVEAAREFLIARNEPEPQPVSAHEQMIRRQRQASPPMEDEAASSVGASPLLPPAGRSASIDVVDGFKLDELEEELQINLQAQRRRKKKAKRRGRRSIEPATPGGEEEQRRESSEEEPAHATPPPTRGSAEPKLAARRPPAAPAAAERSLGIADMGRKMYVPQP